MKERMQFEEFVNVVKENIVNWLPEEFKDAEVKVQNVKKNNNLELTALSILSKDCNMTPTIYLESFFEKYKNGEEMSEVLEQIADVHTEHAVEKDFDTSFIFDFESCKSKIFPRLVSAEWNKHVLDEVPHVIMEDLAVIYYLDLGVDERGALSTRIHNGFMDLWKIESDELHEIAMKNLTKENDGTFVSMKEMLLETMIKDMMDAFGEEEEVARAMLESSFPEEEVLYVVTNEKRVNGSCEILNEAVIEKVIEKLGDNFYILPSSIHELIVLSSNANVEIDSLRAMVNDVNSTQVELEERLSNNVYVYSRNEGLKIA